ncbi:MAG: undecaprenyl-diphosphate phosphatase [Alphaproteobacteria bacterium]|nr:undecaprenyl-diphosphate phosphatase [Reyranella sp.]MBL6940116.1 undecaprenyl-diphosphate phosphatase [Alphaproteobacteria bacterium]MBL7100203.1 undecaprenyl-diphosphate phosphatase [Alphaproteobacteria bacterium]
MNHPSYCQGNIDTGFVALGPAKVALLGVVQGITELLPVSSTAHMRVVPALLGWPDPGSAFSAAMQLAALLAVVAYFRSDIVTITRGAAVSLRGGHWRARDVTLALGVVLATVPIMAAGALLSRVLNACGSPLRSPLVIGIACLVMAALMAAAERLARHDRSIETLTYRDAIVIGLAQIGALIPGVSRSGSTFTGALFLGFKREDAARVSFLLGVPAIALAGLRELWLLAHLGLSRDAWIVLAVGLGVSSASAFLAIWGLMRFLERMSTWPLIAYRAAFGLLLTVGALTNWIR